MAAFILPGKRLDGAMLRKMRRHAGGRMVACITLSCRCRCGGAGDFNENHRHHHARHCSQRLLGLPQQALPGQRHHRLQRNVLACAWPDPQLNTEVCSKQSPGH